MIRERAFGRFIFGIVICVKGGVEARGCFDVVVECLAGGELCIAGLGNIIMVLLLTRKDSII